MLKEYNILNKIPAYDLKRVGENADFYGKGINETLERYKENTICRNDKKDIVKEINYMIDNCKPEEDALLVLNVILNDEELLNKTKICKDGSFRNVRIYNSNSCGMSRLDCDELIYHSNCKKCPKRKYTATLAINWKNVIDGEIGNKYREWTKFHDSITKEDIIKVLNNIEEIFIQP